MNKQMILNMLGLTEQQILEEVSKYNLTAREIELFNKGKEFIEETKELNGGSSIRRILLSLAVFEFIQERNGK